MSNVFYLPVYTTDTQYLSVLRMTRDDIANGRPFEFSDTPQCLTCSWGLQESTLRSCGAGVLKERCQTCPLESPQSDDLELSGCYWRCRVWQATEVPTRDEILSLYDAKIAELEHRLRKTA